MEIIVMFIKAFICGLIRTGHAYIDGPERLIKKCCHQETDTGNSSTQGDFGPRKNPTVGPTPLEVVNWAKLLIKWSKEGDK